MGIELLTEEQYLEVQKLIELARNEYEKGKPLFDAALEGARLRLCPILMTSLAYIFGCLPLWFATGSGAVSRRVLGSTVIGGMIAASGIAIFLISVTFYVIERFFASRKTATQPEKQTPVAEIEQSSRAAIYTVSRVPQSLLKVS
jgi:HAE1 family hydrophobic/amphiphilic exporter-1